MEHSHAVIDIGSNTVRLVIFGGTPPDHRRLVDRKVACRLADGLDATGALSRRGVALALDTVGDFLAQIDAAGPGSLDISLDMVATAAVREAADGPAFAVELERRFDHRVRVLTGEDEARLSATGVLTGARAADGLIADLGGGSLELVEVNRGALGRSASLPLGHVRLGLRAGADRAALDRTIEDALDGIAWLAAVAGRRLYLAGGAWRKLARRHIAAHEAGTPLQGYAVPAAEATRFAATLSEAPRCGPGRPDALVIAARLVADLVEAARPEAVEFSARGLADGCYLARCTASAA